MKLIKKLVVIFLSLLIAAGCGQTVQNVNQSAGNQNNFNQQNTNEKPANPNRSDTTKWQIFTDSQSGLSFSYPPDWKLTQDASSTVCLKAVDGATNCAMNIHISHIADEAHHTGTVSNEELINALKKKYVGETLTSEKNVVNGLHLLKYSAKEETQIFIEHPPFDYNISVTNRDIQNDTATNYQDALVVLNSLATTLKTSK